ncbi:MAG: signal peptidase I, partial [Candidatus Moranbacteria bacterium]|nr:signal peptidase I [Candidatus Moranbacteria bacterium]
MNSEESQENPLEENKDNKYGKLKTLGAYIFELLKVGVFSLVIIVPIRTFIFQPFFVQGASMEPTFHNGEYLIINEFGYKKTVVGVDEKKFFTVEPFKEITRKEVIVFRNPQDPKEYFIKRVIGLPGDRVEIKDGDVVLYNDENPQGGILDESDYLVKMLHETECRAQCIFDIKEDEFLVLGDNRKYSSDSRTWGVLSSDFVIGKVLLRAWPFDKISLFNQ